MSFEVSLHPPIPSYPSQPQGTYHPGQTLSGILTYTLPKQRNLTSITLTLRGKIETNYIETRSSTGAGLTHGPRRPMQEVIRLFSSTRTLFTGPYDVPPQTFTWDFEFVIPREVEYVRSDERGASKGFIDDGWGLLPPSFEWIDRTISHDASVKIKYKLVAAASPGTNRLGGDEEREWPVLVRCLSGVPDPEIVPEKMGFHTAVDWKSHKLRGEGEKLTVRQRMKSIVSDDEGLRAPGIKFKAWIALPRCFAAMQRFGVEFGIVHERGDGDPVKPKLVLQHVKLGLKARTQMRCKKGGFVGMTLSGERQCYGIHLVAERTAKEVGLEETMLPLDGTGVYIGEMCVGEWRDGEVATMMGDFVTWTVSYGYWFSVQVSIRHEETGKLWTLEAGFPVEMRNPYVPELGLVGHKGHTNGDDDLPAYGDDIQPPTAEGSSRRQDGELPTYRDEKNRFPS